MTVASNYHIEVNPNDAGIYDRIVIQELIKTIAQAQQLDISGQRDFKGKMYASLHILCLLNTFLYIVIVLTEVDKLTKDAQHALRRTMEKYMATCRLILIANSTSKIIAPLRSRCLGIRVPAPSPSDVTEVLQVKKYFFLKRNIDET